MAKNDPQTTSTKTQWLWIGAGALLVGLLFARVIFPELVWLSALLGAPLLAVLGLLTVEYRKSRAAAYGLNSAITILLVVAIVGVLNFLASRYPLKKDLTKNQLHTLSDQSVKLVKSLQKPIKATFYSKPAGREQYRPLLENYKSLSPKFELEYVDPDKEPTRAKTAGVRKYGTLQLQIGARDSKIEDLTEEKITNALIKLLKEKSPTLCPITGHGEKNFSSQDAEGFDAIKRALGSQAYEVKEISLIQEQKIPDSCDAVAVLGPTKTFFGPELKMLKDYLANGGRAIIGLDINLKGGEYSPDLISLLQDWNIKPINGLIVDPLSRMFGVDYSIAPIAVFSKNQAITKDFQMTCYFPFARPLDIIPGAPAGLNVQWIAQSTPKSWAIMDLKTLAKGEVRFVQGRDKPGPLNVAVTVEGKQKDSKAARNTRLVVFGSSFFGNNNFSRLGANQDFFMNSVSWIMEDESLISIRAKEEGPGHVDLSQKSGAFVFLLTVILIPLLIAAGGITIWALRRRL